jgi:PAS domain S-box-containing protein
MPLTDQEQQDLLKRVNDIVWKMDMSFNLLYVSPSCERAIGFTQEERLSQTIESQMTPDSYQKAVKLFADELDRENEPGCIPDRSITVELEYYHKDGRTLWFENVVSWNRNAAGEIIGIQGISRDISERRIAYQALKESEEKFRMAFFTSPDSININRLEDGMYLEINQGFTQIMGYTREDVLGKTSLELNIWKNSEDRKRLVEGLKSDGYVENLEAEFCGKNNRIRYGLMSARVLQINNENVILSLTRDITERKHTENKIKQHAENLTAIFDSSPSVLALVDQDLSVEMINRKGSELVGKKKETLSGIICGKVFNCQNSFNGDGCGNNHPCSNCPLRTRISSTYETGKHHIEEEGQMTFILNDHKTVMDVLISTALLEIGDNKKVLLSLTDISKQKQIERSLKQSEQRFQLAMDASKDGLYDWNLETKEIYYSPGWKRMLGYEPEELPNNFSVWEKLTHPEDVKSSWEMLQEVIEKKRDRFENEFRMRHKEGHWIDIFSRASIFNNDEGRAVRVVGTHVDLSEFKKAAAAQKKSEERFRGIAESISDWIWEVDADGRYTFCSEHVERILGYQCHEILGRTPFEFMVPEEIETQKQQFNKIISERRVIRDMRNWNLHKDGRRICLLTNGVPILNEQGELIGFRGIDKDITEQIIAESLLKESETIHRELFDISPTPLYIQDFSETAECLQKIKNEIGTQDLKDYLKKHPDKTMRLAETVKIVKGNKAAVETYKTGSEENLNKTLASALKQDDMQHFINQIVHFTDGKDRFESEARNVDQEGNILDVLLRKQVINRERNGLSKIFVSAVDITNIRNFQREREKLEARLQQAQKMESIGNLAGGIAHDFNNILFPIIGMSEMLLEDLPPGSIERENAEEIFKAGRRGSDLVKQILAFSRQSEHKLTPTHIQNIIKEVIKLSRASIPTYIEINQEIQQDCGLVMADPSQIHQIGMNLITNAYHAVEAKGGKIFIRLKQTLIDDAESLKNNLSPGAYSVLSISDNGHGMSEEIMTKIFDPYFTTKVQGKGTGLGLAVVYGIVKEHQGDVKVYSEIGKGSTFDIYLPLMKKDDRIESVHTPEAHRGGNERILLVDDEESVAKLEKQMLERMGYKVTCRLHSFEALEAFRASPSSFDLVVSDMSMPNIPGDELARKIKSIRSDVPIIICTGFSERIHEGNIRQMGIDGLLMKPVVISELAKTVRKILDGSKKS